MWAAAGMRRIGSAVVRATAARMFPSRQVVVAEKQNASLESAGGDSSFTGRMKGGLVWLPSVGLRLQIAAWLLFHLRAVKPKNERKSRLFLARTSSINRYLKWSAWARTVWLVRWEKILCFQPWCSSACGCETFCLRWGCLCCTYFSQNVQRDRFLRATYFSKACLQLGSRLAHVHTCAHERLMWQLWFLSGLQFHRDWLITAHWRQHDSACLDPADNNSSWLIVDFFDWTHDHRIMLISFPA